MLSPCSSVTAGSLHCVCKNHCKNNSTVFDSPDCPLLGPVQALWNIFLKIPWLHWAVSPFTLLLFVLEVSYSSSSFLQTSFSIQWSPWSLLRLFLFHWRSNTSSLFPVSGVRCSENAGSVLLDWYYYCLRPYSLWNPDIRNHNGAKLS